MCKNAGESDTYKKKLVVQLRAELRDTLMRISRFCCMVGILFICAPTLFSFLFQSEIIIPTALMDIIGVQCFMVGIYTYIIKDSEDYRVFIPPLSICVVLLVYNFSNVILYLGSGNFYYIYLTLVNAVCLLVLLNGYKVFWKELFFGNGSFLFQENYWQQREIKYSFGYNVVQKIFYGLLAIELMAIILVINFIPAYIFGQPEDQLNVQIKDQLDFIMNSISFFTGIFIYLQLYILQNKCWALTGPTVYSYTILSIVFLSIYYQQSTQYYVVLIVAMVTIIYGWFLVYLSRKNGDLLPVSKGTPDLRS